VYYPDEYVNRVLLSGGGHKSLALTRVYCLLSVAFRRWGRRFRKQRGIQVPHEFACPQQNDRRPNQYTQQRRKKIEATVHVSQQWSALMFIASEALMVFGGPGGPDALQSTSADTALLTALLTAMLGRDALLTAVLTALLTALLTAMLGRDALLTAVLTAVLTALLTAMLTAMLGRDALLTAVLTALLTALLTTMLGRDAGIM
jgi:hypothetical protein